MPYATIPVKKMMIFTTCVHLQLLGDPQSTALASYLSDQLTPEDIETCKLQFRLAQELNDINLQEG